MSLTNPHNSSKVASPYWSSNRRFCKTADTTEEVQRPNQLCFKPKAVHHRWHDLTKTHTAVLTMTPATILTLGVKKTVMSSTTAPTIHNTTFFQVFQRKENCVTTSQIGTESKLIIPHVSKVKSSWNTLQKDENREKLIVEKWPNRRWWVLPASSSASW